MLIITHGQAPLIDISPMSSAPNEDKIGNTNKNIFMTGVLSAIIKYCLKILLQEHKEKTLSHSYS